MKSKPDGGKKVTTRCVADNRQYTDNIVSTNRKTTRSWPVICRTKCDQFSTNEPNHQNIDDYFDDDEDYDTIFDVRQDKRDDTSRTSSTENLAARKYLIVDYHHTQRPSTDFTSKASAQRKSIVARMSTSSQPAAVGSLAAAGGPAVSATGASACTTPPPVVFLLVTLLMTIGATAMMCVAVMTDHWETISWDRQVLTRLCNSSSHTLHWHLGDRVARLSTTRK